MAEGRQRGKSYIRDVTRQFRQAIDQCNNQFHAADDKLNDEDIGCWCEDYMTNTEPSRATHYTLDGHWPGLLLRQDSNR